MSKLTPHYIHPISRRKVQTDQVLSIRPPNISKQISLNSTDISNGKRPLQRITQIEAHNKADDQTMHKVFTRKPGTNSNFRKIKIHDEFQIPSESQKPSICDQIRYMSPKWQSKQEHIRKVISPLYKDFFAQEKGQKEKKYTDQMQYSFKEKGIITQLKQENQALKNQIKRLKGQIKQRQFTHQSEANFSHQNKIKWEQNKKNIESSIPKINTLQKLLRECEENLNLQREENAKLYKELNTFENIIRQMKVQLREKDNQIERKGIENMCLQRVKMEYLKYKKDAQKEIEGYKLKIKTLKLYEKYHTEEKKAVKNLMELSVKKNNQRDWLEISQSISLSSSGRSLNTITEGTGEGAKQRDIKNSEKLKVTNLQNPKEGEKNLVHSQLLREDNR